MKIPRKRAYVACESCRDSKQKCINSNDTQPCERCKRNHTTCRYTLVGAQLKNRTIIDKYDQQKKTWSNLEDKTHLRKRLVLEVDESSKYIPAPFKKTEVNTKEALGTYSLNPDLNPVSENNESLVNDRSREIRSSISLVTPKVILPPKKLLLEIVAIFFDNQYHLIFPFIHKPLLLGFLRLEEFDPTTYMEDYYDKYFAESYKTLMKYPDPVLLLALLALTARLHPDTGNYYGSFSEDNDPDSFEPSPNQSGLSINGSRYFGWHSRNRLKLVFDSPTIQRVQALSMLSSHEWGEGNASRSYMYVGIAARMALVLGLGSETEMKQDEDLLDFQLIQESKRRTIWLVYMMDRCNGSGRHRVLCMRVDEIQVRLPCSEKDFLFGRSQNDAITYKEAEYSLNHKKYAMVLNTSCWGFQLLLFEIWRKIANWVGKIGGRAPQLPPWEKDLYYYKLLEELSNWEAALPPNLSFLTFNLEAHISDNSAANFGYMHALFFLGRIFLNREYFYCSPELLPAQWWGSVASQLLLAVDRMHVLISLLEEINMMVIAPFTSFEVFTIATTCMYVQQFPTALLKKYFPAELLPEGAERDIDFIKTKYLLMASLLLKVLEDWKHKWEMANRWYGLTLKFRELLLQTGCLIQDDEVHHQLHDYGTGKVNEVYIPTKADSKPVNKVLNLVSSFDFQRGTTPILDFMDSFDLANILPGWNDAVIS